MSVLEHIGLCHRDCNSGSMPKIIYAYPPLELSLSKSEQEDFIKKSFPPEVESGTFHLDTIDGNYLISYIFRVNIKGVANQHGGAGGYELASFTVVISDKKVNISQFQELFKILVEKFQPFMKFLDMDKIVESLEEIYRAVNEIDKITMYNNNVVDLPAIIEEHDLRIKKHEIKNLKDVLF
ncbi:MAG: hypothetical protein ACTSUE_07930 [Promethearchaeota archaeon]